MKTGLSDYNQTENRKDWVLSHFGQVVSVICQIVWCQTTEVNIQDNETNPGTLQDWYEQNVKELGVLTELVRGKLTSIQRKIIVSLVTTDVHSRDIVENLVKENVSSLSDFNWQQQLRYYWDEDPTKDDCVIKQV